MSKRISGLIVVLCVAISVCVWLVLLRQDDQHSKGELSKVRLGISLQPTSTLVFIAQEEGYFSEESLEVQIKTYPSGKRALQDGLFRDEVDVATTGDVPVVFNSFKRSDFSIFASIGSADSIQRVIARRDKGILKPADLKNKVMATQKASQVHFFMRLFLLNNGLTYDDVDIIFKKAEELPQALVDGEIDAFCMREPYISAASGLLGDNAVVFAAKGLYVSEDCVVAHNSYIKDNPEVINKIIRAIVKAETFAENNPEQALDIAVKTLGTTKAEMASLWDAFSFKVSLSQTLIVGLEDVARWTISDELTEEEGIPNYLDFIYARGLEDEKPEAVNLIH